MRTARAEVSKPVAGSRAVIPCRRLPRVLDLNATAPYTEEQIDRFCATLAGALAKPEAFKSMIDRIGALLAKASPSRR